MRASHRRGDREVQREQLPDAQPNSEKAVTNEATQCNVQPTKMATQKKAERMAEGNQTIIEAVSMRTKKKHKTDGGEVQSRI